MTKVYDAKHIEVSIGGVKFPSTIPQKFLQGEIVMRTTRKQSRALRNFFSSVRRDGERSYLNGYRRSLAYSDGRVGDLVMVAKFGRAARAVVPLRRYLQAKRRLKRARSNDVQAVVVRWAYS